LIGGRGAPPPCPRLLSSKSAMPAFSNAIHPASLAQLMRGILFVDSNGDVALIKSIWNLV
jgi:hypothetical protein